MKKILKIVGVLICGAVLFLNLSINTKGKSENLDLPRLKLMQEANAECWPMSENGGGLPGHCMAESCFWTDHDFDCDYTRM